MKQPRIFALLALSTLASACAMAPARNDSSPVAAAVITAGSTSAQLPAPNDPYLDPEFLASELTADRAVQAALVNNPGVRAQLARLDAAQAERVQAGLIANPMLSLMALRPEGGGRFEIDYSLMQNLFDLITRSRRVAVADAASKQVEAEVISTLVAIVQDTKAAFYDAIAAQAIAESARDGSALENEVLQLRTGQARQGAIRASDVTDQQAVVSKQGYDLRSAEAALAKARAALARQLGLTSASQLRLPDSVPTFVLPGIDAPALQVLATLHRASLAGADAGVQQARSDRALSTGGWRATQPSLGVAGMRETSGMSLAGPAVLLSLPVFDIGSARRDLANARVAQAEFSAESVRRQVPLEVELAIAALIAADQAAGNARDNLDQQMRLETLARQTYRQGGTDSSPVFDAHRARLASAKDLIEAQRIRWAAAVDLEKATGVAVLQATTPRQ